MDSREPCPLCVSSAAKARRYAEERDDAEESVRVWKRVMARTLREKDALVVENERLRRELAAREG